MSIPTEKYLGVYFKAIDEDLIQWKKGTPKGDRTEFAKQAIREKLQREQTEQKLEHPTVILRRVERVLIENSALLSRILRMLDGAGVSEINVKSSLHSVTNSVPIDLDKQCVEAGWK